MMAFLYPTALWLLSLGAVLVFLYLRRVRRREVALPSLLLWQGALSQQRHRAFLGRLRQWLSLLMLLLILLLLVLALARPEQAMLGPEESIVIVLDTRARMQAGSRFSEALEQARQVASQAREGRSVTLLTAGDGGGVAVPFSDDPEPLLAALHTLRPNDTGGTLAPTVALAQELLASRNGQGRLIVIGSPRDEKLPESGFPVERRVVGQARDNVAITRFSARPEANDPRTATVQLALANFSAATAQGNVEIHRDETLLDVRPFTLAAGETMTLFFPTLPLGSGVANRLSARIAPPHRDALPLDDRAEAVLPAYRPVRLLLVSEGNFFLEKLFNADPALRFDLLRPGDFRPGMASSFDVVIYDRTGPTALNEISGNAIFIGTSPLTPDAPTMSEPVISEIDESFSRGVAWNQVTLLETLQLPEAKPQEGWQFETRLRSFDHPLLLTGERRDETPQRIAILAFDLTRSDLPLRIGFPLLMSHLIHWTSAASGDRGSYTDVATGTQVTLNKGETVTLPDGRVASEVFQPLKAGFYTVAPEGTWFAANLFDEEESDLRPRDSDLLATTPPTFAGVLARRPLWHWLVLAAIALLTLEWGLYHRRRTE